MVREGERACSGWRRGVRGGCWKGVWEAQVEAAVLADWERFRDVSWNHDLNAANHATLSHILSCLPYISPNPEPSSPPQCTPAILTVILSVNWWLDLTLLNTGETGECVWLRTISETARAEGVSFLSVYHEDYAGMMRLYAALPDVITMVWGSEALVVSCMSDPHCREDFPEEDNPKGVKGVIPSCKMITASYWGARETSWEYGQRAGDGFSFNPLGHEWTIVPFPYPGHTYIPFTLERMCETIPVVPHAERVDEAVILGKLTSYFYRDRVGGLAPPEQVWKSFHAKTGLWPIANAHVLNDDPAEPPTTPQGIINRGPMDRDPYTAQIGHAKVLIGIGMPAISPSPYLALCQGVPALIPYDGDDPTPSGWQLYNLGRTQHGPAALLGEPYVYSYNRYDVQSMYDAVKKAKARPIEPFIPDDMRYAHVAKLAMQMIRTDWRAKAEAVEKDRRTRGVPVRGRVPAYVRETVFRNGWGMRIGEEGKVSRML